MCPKRKCPKRDLDCPKRDLSLLTRRDWIRIFALGTATQLGLGAGKPQQILAALAPSVNNSCVLSLRPSVSPFTALQFAGGSVRVKFSTFFNPFIVTRDVVENPPGVFNDVFYAFDSTCTHENFATNAYNAGDGLMTCTNHGSTYDIQGNVVFAAAGEGQANLKRLPVAYDGNDLVEVELKSSFNIFAPNIQPQHTVAETAVPAIPLKISNLTVQSQNASVTRWRITFPAARRANYRIKYYADMTSAPQQPYPYFTTATGTSSTTAVISYPITGNNDSTVSSYYVNPNFSVWVELPNTATKGFFAVEMIYPL